MRLTRDPSRRFPPNPILPLGVRRSERAETSSKKYKCNASDPLQRELRSLPLPLAGTFPFELPALGLRATGARIYFFATFRRMPMANAEG